MMLNILYTGPGISGRTTSLQHIAKLAVPTFNPLAEPAAGWQFRFPIDGEDVALCVQRSGVRSWLTIPVTSTDPRMTRERDFLRRVDGMVFLIDSQQSLRNANKDILDKTVSDLALIGRSIDDVAVVFQLNKRDTPTAEPVDVLKDHFHTPWCEYVESVAKSGDGVVDALQRVVRLLRDRTTRAATRRTPVPPGGEK